MYLTSLQQWLVGCLFPAGGRSRDWTLNTIEHNCTLYNCTLNKCTLNTIVPWIMDNCTLNTIVPWIMYNCTLNNSFEPCTFEMPTVLLIPNICQLFDTHTFWGLKILLSKQRKVTTKIVPRQNSVNLIVCTFIHTVYKSTFIHTVYKSTYCVKQSVC